MPVIALYILKIILCSAILVAYYWLALRNKIFHQYNRFYLLASVMLSIILPFIQINIWSFADEASTGTIRLLKVVSSGNEYLDAIIVTARSNQFTTAQLFQLLYLSVSVVMLCLFIQSILKIRKLYNGNRQTITQGISLIHTDAPGTPFSFLKYIFWNNSIDINSITGQQIFKHELAHVQQKHTHDKLFINMVLVVLWCNPIFWLIKKELNMIHEFIADKKAVEDNDTSSFASMILQAVYPQQHFQLTNQFFYSPIKRRIAMITKNKNTKTGYIGRVLVLPLLFITFAAFSFKTNYHSTIYNGKPVTIVINAGHGGKDAGAQSIAGDVHEKDLTLSIIKKIKALNTNKNLNIVFTREDDSYQSPQEIATITNARHPDLFVSIHLGNAENDKDNPSGMDVFVAKDNFSNAAKSKLFASAIINQFSSNYGLPVAPNPQQREQGIWTLQEIICPAVLIEAGYLSNEKDLAYLQTDNAKERIAQNILIAVEKYAAVLNKQGNVTVAEQQPGKQVGVSKAGVTPVAAVKINPVSKDPPPLYILDGKEVDSNFMKTVSPDEIDRIDVLKGDDATKKYGEKGKYGVVIITTKKAANLQGKQTEKPNQPGDDKVFTKVENEADFIGGRDAWIKYLTSNIDGTIPVKEGWKPGKYNVIVEFIVDKEGNISEVKAVNYQGTKTAAHCIELIQKGPKWKPALQNGQAVKAYRKQPITFVVE